jgi:hypothetical protein
MFKKSVIFGNYKNLVVVSKHLIVAPNGEGGIVFAGIATPEACKEVADKLILRTNDVLSKTYATINKWRTNMPDEVKAFHVAINDNNTITVSGLERSCIIDGILYFINMSVELVSDNTDEYVSFEASINTCNRED